MKDRNVKQRVTITGIVKPEGWEENEEVTAVSISTAGEEEYLVTDNKRGEELLDLVGEKVKVTGITREDEFCGNIITVEQYEVFGSSKEDQETDWAWASEEEEEEEEEEEIR